MMGLMVEDMGDGLPERRLVPLSATHVHEWSGEPFVAELRDPGRQLVVAQRSLATESFEIGVQLLVQGADAVRAHEAVRDGHALETCEPNPVRDEQVIERAVDRLEERSAVALACF